jgi:hypothetical protein
MDTLDVHGMKNRYVVMDNATIHEVLQVYNITSNRGYKITYRLFYSSFLNLVEMFQGKS